MSRRSLILRCKHIVNDCTRRLLEDDVRPDLVQTTIRRLDVVQRTIRWARGRLITVPAANQLLSDLDEYIQELRTNFQAGQPGTSGYQAQLVWSEGRGRRHYNITAQQLLFLRSIGFTLPQMADILNVSVRTVKRRLRQFNLTRLSQFADMEDVDLDDTVRDIVAGNDMLGPEAVRAALRSRGIRVQRRRVRASMLRINPGAAAVRALLRRPERRVYHVAGPNSLWHIDGNHKLIRWRIVIHGAIDGYSRLVVFLRASNNNRSSTVLDSFLNAVVRYGVPSRVRTDRGGENNAVALLMNIFRGVRRGSVLQGRSVHNQRIERLWGDLWRGMTNVYYWLFTHLENEHIINIDNDMHLWALHYVYLPRINRDLTHFMNQWNNHGLRTERHMTPLQIFVRGCLQQQGRDSTAMRDIFGVPDAGVAPAPVAPATTSNTRSVPAAAAPAATADAAATLSPEEGELALLVDWPERITVPETRHNLDSAIMQQIQDQFDPLSGPRGEYGMSILCDLISFLESVTQ